MHVRLILLSALCWVCWPPWVYQHTQPMAHNPFRKCDYCGSTDRSSRTERRYERRAWTIFPHTRKLACPTCQQTGRDEDTLCLRMLRTHTRLLGHRIAADPPGTYGDVPLRKTHRIALRGHASEVDVCRMGDELYGLDGSWNVAMNDRTVRIILRYERDPKPAPALYGQEHAASMVEEDAATYGDSLSVQYVRMKLKYPDPLLLYRDGDRYRSFGADADTVHWMTGAERIVHRGAIPPFDVEATFRMELLEKHLPTLVRGGYRVAICDPVGGTPVPGMVCEPERKDLFHLSLDGLPTTCATVSEPVEQYRSLKRLYLDALLVLRDHQGYMMLYKDAQRAANVLKLDYPGNGPFRIAKNRLEFVLDELVRAGYRVAVVIDPKVDDPRNAKQVDLWDAIDTEVTVVAEGLPEYSGQNSLPPFPVPKMWSQKATTTKAAIRLEQARSTGHRARRGRADRGRPPHSAPMIMPWAGERGAPEIGVECSALQEPPTPYTNNFRANLRALRDQRDMSQQAIAELVGVKRSTYAAWENGDSEPGLRHLLVLQQVHGIGMDVLVGSTIYAYTVEDLDRARMAFAPRPRIQQQAA